MSDLSEEDDSMDEDDCEESGSSDEEESGEESGSDSELDDEESHSEMNDLTAKNVQQVELSSSSDEGNERDRCPVCLNRFIGQDLGIPENCEHIFCFDCINEWASNINTCPIDRNEFNYVHLKRSPDGKVLRKVRIHVKEKEPEEGPLAEDSTLCEVCRLGDREHRLLLCDSCDLAYHCDCLDPPLFSIPIEEWFCPPCSSVLTQMGDGALPSTSRSRRVIPRTSASESVRVRVQNRRTYPSTASRSTASASTSRPKKRKRRSYRRCIKKVVKLARTKAGGAGGKGGKDDRATAVMVTYRKIYRRRKRRKTKKKSTTRLPSRSAESNLQSAKERIAKRLGLCNSSTGTAIPDVRSKAGPSSKGGSSSSNRTHSLFGARDQLMDFNENFNEDLAVPSTSRSTPRSLPERSEASAAPSNLLDSILAGQKLLHTKSDNVIIRNDGSLVRKEVEKKKEASKSVVRVGLYKPDVASSKHGTQEKAKASSSSLLHGALTKKKSSESHSSPNQKADTSSSNSGKDIFEKIRKIKKEKEATFEGSSHPTKKSSNSYTKHGEKKMPSSSISPVIASKNPIKIVKSADKRDSAKRRSSTLQDNLASSSSDTHFVSKQANPNLLENKNQTEKSQQLTSLNVQNNVPDHRLDILQKRASFLEKFNTKPSVSDPQSNTGCVVQKSSHQSVEIKSTTSQANEIKIKDEPLSSDDEETHSESLIGQASSDKCFSTSIKTEFQASESLLGNSSNDLFFFTTRDSSLLENTLPTSVKKEPVSSDEESIDPMPSNTFSSKTRIKEEPEESLRDKLNNLPCTQVESFKDLPFPQALEHLDDLPCTQAVDADLPCTQAEDVDFPCTQAVDIDLPCTQAVDIDLPCTQAVNVDLPCTQAVDVDLPCTQAVDVDLPCTQAVECFEDLPCTQADHFEDLPAVDRFEDLPCTQALNHFEDLPCTQAVEHLETLPFTKAVKHFEDLPCTQAVERFDDLPCTQAVVRFDDLPCTQAVDRFDDLPCTQAVVRFDDLPCTQAVNCFDDLPCTQAVGFENLPCTQAVKRFEDLPCTQAVERFDDLSCTQAVECFEDLPCTQAVERFDNLPCTQAVECFEDLPCTQAVDCSEDLPCTQAEKCFDDLPCTQAVKHLEDLPATQAVDDFEDLPCTQAIDLPCTQAVEHFEDLPCTQAAEKLHIETVFKVPKPPIHTSKVSSSKLSSNHSELKNSKALKDNSDLPATQLSDQGILNSSTQDFSGSKKEDKKDGNLLNTSLLDDEELLDAKKAVALLRSGGNKVKTPPKVVGVHRNLPQVITSVPVRRPLIPKPINKQTFSFDQVKQHFNLEETQKSNLSETNSKVSVQFKSVTKTESHLSSDSDSEHVPKLRQIIPNTTLHKASSHETHSKGLAIDCKGKKNSNNLLDNTKDSKLIISSLNKETLQGVSNIKVNMVNKSPQSLDHSKGQSQPPSDIPQTDCFTSHDIKKEPLDIHESNITQKPCAVNKVDEHVGESNLARALRIKREMNLEILKQNALKVRMDVAKGSDMLRVLSIKQEKNLEVMRENMLKASFENTLHVNGTPGSPLVGQMKHRNDHKVKEMKQTTSVHIKTEKVDEPSINQNLKKDKGTNKASEIKLIAKCIKKEPEERQEKCTKTRSNSFDKTLDKTKKSKSDLCNKEGKDKERNSEKINKPIGNNKCKEENLRNDKSKEKNPPSKSKYVCDKKNSENKFTEEEDHSHKESNSERKNKFQEKGRRESKESNSDGIKKSKADIDHPSSKERRNSVKDHLSSKERSDNSVKDHHSSKEKRDSVKDHHSSKERRDSVKDHHSSKERRNSAKDHLISKERSENSVKDHRSSKEKMNNSMKDQVKRRDSDVKSNHADQDKNGSRVSISNSSHRKVEENKHLNVEKNSHSRNKYIEKDEHYDKERNASSKNKPEGKDKNGNKKSNIDRKNTNLENCESSIKEKSYDTKCGTKEYGGKDRNSYRKEKQIEKDKNSSRISNQDRKNKHSENNNPDYKEVVADSKNKHSEKHQYDDKHSKCAKNKKPFLKDSEDRYSDSKTKNTEKDRHYKRSHSQRENAHTDKDKSSSKKSSFDSRHEERETRENHTPKGNTHCVKTGHLEKDKHKETYKTIKKELPDAFDELFDGSIIKKESPSIESRKRSIEHSNNPNHENKKRKTSKEAEKQTLSSSSKSYISPDSTSGPDTANRLSEFNNSKHGESPLDARIREMMNHGDFDTRSSKKPRLESLCSEDTSGCFSDISQLSNEKLIKTEVMEFTSPLEQKHLISSLKDSSEHKSSKELKEEIASEIKLILKPFFSVGVVNKEDYKDIMRRAVPKVFLNCGNCVNPEKIKKLVLSYVAKLRNS